MSLAISTFGLDNAATVDYGVAYAKGSRFQFRYSNGAGPSTSSKLCKVGEIAEIVGAGTDFIANSEWYETRVTEGAAAGKADGAADLAFWKSRNYARGASIYPSWDAAPNSTQYDAVAAYLSAYNTALGGYYLCDGLYAGIPALNEMADRGLIKHGWVTESSSWSAVPNTPIPSNYAPPAKTLRDLWQPIPSQYGPAIAMLQAMLHPGLVSCVWQTGNHWSNGSDENVILRSGPLGSQMEASGTSSSGGGTPVPTPTNEEDDDDMANFAWYVDDGDGHTYVVEAYLAYKDHLATPAADANIKSITVDLPTFPTTGRGFITRTFDPSLLKAIPNRSDQMNSDPNYCPPVGS